jgi:hypothetical protein
LKSISHGIDTPEIVYGRDGSFIPGFSEPLNRIKRVVFRSPKIFPGAAAMGAGGNE